MRRPWIFLVFLLPILLLFSCVKTTDTGVPTPQLVHPINYAIVGDETLKLEWSVESPYSGWIYEVFLMIPGKGLEFKDTTTSTSVEIENLKGGLYEWWVVLKSPGEKDKESVHEEFYYGGPGELTVVYPLGGTLQPGEVELSWKTENPLGIDHFEVWINGQSIETTATGVIVNLKPNTEYTWKVKMYMKNGAVSESDMVSFKTAPLSIKLLSPEDGADDLHPDNITLVWEADYDFGFLVHLIHEEDEDVLFSQSTNIRLEGLDYDSEYSWYIETAGIGDGKSEARTFRTLKPSPPTLDIPSGLAEPDAVLSWDYNDPNFTLEEFILLVGYSPEYDHTIVLNTRFISVGDLAVKIGEPIRTGDDIYIAVRAVDGRGRRTPSAQGVFRIKPIELIQPSDGAQDVTASGYVFKWTGDDAYSEYELHIVGENERVIRTSDTAVLVEDLKPGQDYLWYVVADGKFRSQTASFKTSSQPYIELIQPQDNAQDLDPDDLVFSWKALDDFDEYTLHIEGGGKTYDYSTSDTRVVVSGLDYDTVYLWYVVGERDDGSTERSQTNAFKTYTVPAPSIINPVDGQIGVSITDFLMWSFSDPIFDFDHYELWMGTSVNLTESTTLKANSIAIEDAASIFGITLNSSEVIYWAVRAVDELGRTSETARAAFRIE